MSSRDFIGVRGWRAGVLALCATLAFVSVSAGQALADTAVPGSEYAVVFNGTGSENVSYQTVDQGGPAPSSGRQTGTWTINDDNNGPGVWLPATKSPAEEGVAQTFQAWHDDFDSSGHPIPVAASLSESGQICCTGDPPQLFPYSCSASSVYDNGIGTLTAAVVLGNPTLATEYGNNDRTFVAGHPDPNQPNGVSFDGGLSCQDPQDGSSYGSIYGGGFRYSSPDPNGTDRIAYSASIPLASVGQQTITAQATDQSKITDSAVCDPSDTIDYASCDIHVSLQGAYTLTKLCDGAINYTSTGLKGTCGEAPPAGSVKGAGSAQVSDSGTAAVGDSSCTAASACTDSTTVTGTGSGGRKLLATGRKKAIVYARGKTTVPAGKTKKLKVKLTKKALNQLKKAGKLKSKVRVVIKSSGSKTFTKSFKLTLRAPKG